MDVVYFIREGTNEELRYSLRSLKNLPHDKVWVYGGCPEGIKPDRHVHAPQVGLTKWDRVRNMYTKACENNEISEDFILMNDDFFIMKPTDVPVRYRCSLQHHILEMEMKFNDRITEYTKLLRQAYRFLSAAGKPALSYDLHIPMVINRKKFLDLLKKYPELHAMRTIYGNWYEIGGERMADVKVYDPQAYVDRKATFLSSSDDSWPGAIGDYIKEQFPKRSEYETE